MSRKTTSSAPSRSQAHKVDALDHAAVLNIQTGDHAFGKHGLLLPSGGGQRLCQRKVALVERATSNGTFNRALAHRGKRADIIERRDTARSHDGKAHDLGHVALRRHIDARLHAVARDIGIDQVFKA